MFLLGRVSIAFIKFVKESRIHRKKLLLIKLQCKNMISHVFGFLKWSTTKISVTRRLCKQIKLFYAVMKEVTMKTMKQYGNMVITWR